MSICARTETWLRYASANTLGPEYLLILCHHNTGRKPLLSPQTLLPSATLCSQSRRSRQTRAGFSLVPKGVLMLWMRLLR